MVSSFWLDNPSILFNKKKILELWPQQKQTMDDKLNAITRLIIILTVLGYSIHKITILTNWHQVYYLIVY